MNKTNINKLKNKSTNNTPLDINAVKTNISGNNNDIMNNNTINKSTNNIPP